MSPPCKAEYLFIVSLIALPLLVTYVPFVWPGLVNVFYGP